MPGRARRATALVAVVVVVAALATTPLWWGGGGAAVPRRVHLPWPWAATVEARPPGPAALVFETDQTRYFEATTVVVGRNGKYRIREQVLGHVRGAVSPDGRLLLDGFDRILDLTTGEIRHLPGGMLMGWSRDGRTVVALGNNGTVNLVDVASRQTRTIYADAGVLNDALAVSPDGSKVVVPVYHENDRRLLLVDATETVVWSVPAARYLMADAIVFSPDGRYVATTADRCVAAQRNCPEPGHGRAVVLDAATGAEVASYAPADRVLGFRGDGLVLARWGARENTLVQVGPGGERTLVTMDAEAGGPDVPLDLVEHGAFGGADAWPNPLAAPTWCYVLLGLLALPFVPRPRRTTSRVSSPSTPAARTP
ncbi:hypothetical protein GCM10022255_099510 [Dactylosporangium darangshiense]|uniref:Uncharacterized protein n=1 Tax=Dactylosporangium darangshiense TaxID=579108 RepID=A0ABP8DRN0_9ACTN